MNKEDKDIILAEIERLKEIGCPLQKGSDYQHGYDEFYTQIKTFINSLPAKQPSKELNKEIDRFIADKVGKTITVGQVAHYFANWRKQQMMKSAIDAKIVNDEMSGCVVDCEQGCLVLEPHRYLIGQKLKILIIKEDE